MFDWTFSFWQMLGITFVTFFVAELIGQVRCALRYRRTFGAFLEEIEEADESLQEVIKVDIRFENKRWYAFEVGTSKFLAFGDTYPLLVEALTKVNSEAVFITDNAKLAELEKKIVEENGESL